MLQASSKGGAAVHTIMALVFCTHYVSKVLTLV